MKNNIEKVLDDFIDVPQSEEEIIFNKKTSEQKKKFLNTVFIDESGRQLLLENA